MKDKNLLKQLNKKLTNEQKEFVKAMGNYAISLCLKNDIVSINELCEIIRFQNERRTKK